MKKLKKVFTVTLITTLLVSNNVSAKTFSDVTSDGTYAWVYESLDNLSNKGIFNGYEDGTFRPSRAVSFLEIMQTIKNIKNPSEDELKHARDLYKEEVESYNVSSWAVDAVCYNLMNSTITSTTLSSASTKGFLNSEVYPNRNSVAVYFARALGLGSTGDESVLKHSDVSSISQITRGYLANLVEAGVFSSTGSNGNFNGDRYITRAEVATIANNSLTYLENKVTETMPLEETQIEEKNQEEEKTQTTSTIYGTAVYKQNSIEIDSVAYEYSEDLVVLDYTGLYAGDLNIINEIEVSATLVDNKIVQISLLMADDDSKDLI